MIRFHLCTISFRHQLVSLPELATWAGATGFDGIEEAARTRPYMATVCQSSVEKGMEAAKLLLSGDNTSMSLPYEIKVGETI